MKNKVSILISSCDKFKDVWPIFSFYFDKNWPDCDLNKFFLSNNEISNLEGFKSITVGDDLSWSSNLQLALKQISTDYVLIMLDDVFIDGKVNNKDFNVILNDFIDLKGNYLKLSPRPKSNIKSNSPYFNTLPPDSLYRATAVFTIWKKETLLELIDVNENPWEFEEYASIRSNKYDGFYVVENDFFKYIHGIVRGKFIKSSYKKILSMHPELSKFLIREVNSFSYELKLFFINLRHNFFYFIIPLKYRTAVKKFVKNKF
jgi:hypothetical protein